jgi:acyl dehydratase
VGDRVGDNIRIHTHKGAILVDDKVLYMGQKMRMLVGLVIGVQGVRFRCMVFPGSDEARSKGLEKEKAEEAEKIMEEWRLRTMMIAMKKIMKALRPKKMRVMRVMTTRAT